MTLLNKFCCYSRSADLDENNNLWSQYITVWQNKTRQIIHEKWKQIKYLEWNIFNDKFFFYCWENNLFCPHFNDPPSNLLNNETSTVADSESDRSMNHYWCLWECSIEIREKICCEADWLMITVNLFIWFSKLDKYLCDCKSGALHFSCTHIWHHHVYTVQLVQTVQNQTFLVCIIWQYSTWQNTYFVSWVFKSHTYSLVCLLSKT